MPSAPSRPRPGVSSPSNRDHQTALTFKLIMAAAKTWRRLKGQNQLPKVLEGVTFKDGVEVITNDAKHAA